MRKNENSTQPDQNMMPSVSEQITLSGNNIGNHFADVGKMVKLWVSFDLY